jgi:hypothetical protein
MNTENENKTSLSLEEYNAELIKLGATSQAPKSPPSTSKKNTGPILGLVIILIGLGSYATGFVPLWVALLSVVVGLLGGILIQLSRIASK